MDIDLSPAETEEGGIHLFLLRPEHVGLRYLSWMCDPDVQRYLDSRYVKHDIASLQRFVREALENPDVLFMGIAFNDVHVGNIKVGPIGRHHLTADVGIMIGDRSHQAKRVGSTAIRLVCDIARRRLMLAKLTAGAYATNQASIRAFQRAGFVIEGVRTQQLLIDDRREDLILLGCIL